VGRRIEVEFLAHALCTGAPDIGRKLRIRQYPPQSPSQRHSIAGRNDQAALAIFDKLGHSPHAGTDHRATMCHGLQQNHGHAL
jgi:hypothetical protein